MKRQLRRVLILALTTLGSVLVAACAYIQPTKFGKLPNGENLTRLEHSPNYKDGQFQNQIATPMLADGQSTVSVLLSNLTTRNDRPRPSTPVPSVKTDLKALEPDNDVVVWLGHSSYFLQLSGVRILIDPVFSTYAAPVSFANRAFTGTSIYSADDMPEIDYLLITHDHWDHLDYDSITALQQKVRHIVVPLGVGSHLRHWGIPNAVIHETDWFDELRLDDDGIVIHALPARHFSGRLLTRNRTLWAGYALITPNRRLFFSGDSGYGPHFRQIGQKFGNFDFVALDTGQCDARWSYIHMVPEEAAQAAQDLNTKALLPSHIGRFTMAKHAWDDPFRRIADAADGKTFRLLTPIIGEPVQLDNSDKRFSRWWEDLE
jgi:L-ascorbate metabolism protein UlaG (beta-lactamase superfamily)